MARTVLVVEDDSDIQQTLQLVLEEEGYSVVTADNGLEALNVLESGLDPCAALVDLMMPVMSGWELIEKMRGSAALAGIPVIVVTAAGEQQGSPEGIAHLLRKPVKLDQLLALLADTCRGAQK
jgi:CheY-like chemotaxis protein